MDVQNTIDNLEQNAQLLEDSQPEYGNVATIMRDAIEALEEQQLVIESLTAELQETVATMNEHVEEIKRLTEPVKPQFIRNEQLFPYCGNCGKLLPVEHGTLHCMKYCGECGRKVDWSR